METISDYILINKLIHTLIYTSMNHCHLITALYVCLLWVHYLISYYIIIIANNEYLNLNLYTKSFRYDGLNKLSYTCKFLF